MEYRKNQLQFLKGMMKNNLPIVFIGNNKFNKGYTALCKKLSDARGNVLFIDHISQEYLFSAYINARVHVLPSWYETPGLSSLEAGAAGCNIVVSDRGSTRLPRGATTLVCAAQTRAIAGSAREARRRTVRVKARHDCNYLFAQHHA